MRRVWVLVACALALAACGSGGGSGDGGTPDAGLKASGGDGGRRGECDLAAQDCASGLRCVPVAPADGGRVAEPACRAGECDVVLQDCPGGERCTYVQDGGVAERRCVPRPEEARAEDEPCGLDPVSHTSLGDCEAGLLCVGESQPDGGGPTGYRCRRFCATSGDCGPHQACFPTLVLKGTDERPGLCTPVRACDPLAQDCPEEQACYLVDGMSLCRPEGRVEVGATCEFADDCVRGSGCFEMETGTRRCFAFCNRTQGGSPACPVGTCIGVKGEAIGVCWQ